MFGWRKRDEGFEWHKYVRTTIKLRRDARREKAHELGAQVAEGVRVAGVAADGLARGGARSLGALVRASAQRIVTAALSAMTFSGRGAGLLSGLAVRGAIPVLDLLGRPGVAGPLSFAGAIAVLAGVARVVLAPGGLDGEALAALLLGLLCLGLGLGPAIWLGHGILPRRFGAPITGLPSRPWMLASSLGLIGLVGAIVMTAGPWRFGLPSAIGLPALPLMGSETIAGKARVVSADQLAIGDRIVRLKGVEVPDRVQRCLRGGAKGNGRTWACGAEAYGTFRRFVQGRAVECSVGRTGEGNVALGSCRVAGVDVGESLVKAGLAFAEAGFASPYRSIEDAARAARAGIWSAASPERPTEWRNRLWTMAKLRAPEGCPIKGRVQGGERIYVLPWSSNYGRVRVNKRRGERWFCTEEEAIAAGWRSPGRG